MSSRVSLIVHGGAGDIPEDERPLHMAGLRRALDAGWDILQKGGSALDSVIAAIEILEDDPVFDAGRGSVLRLDGSIGMDASIMVGSDRTAGAVACLERVRHPIRLAAIVREKTPHVLLVGRGAEDLARQCGLEMAEPESFITEKERLRLERILAARNVRADGEARSDSSARFHGTSGEPNRASDESETNAARGAQGTVGAVARDRSGTIVAGTSTGGAPGCLPGRVGDSPIIGAGTWADDRSGGISCTGRGEYILRATLAREVAREIAKGRSAEEAARWAIEHLRGETGGTCGLIVVDREGRAGSAYSTPFMGSLARSEML